MNRLLNIGFISVGHWMLNNDTIKYNLTSHHTTSNVLYSFISNGEIRYIGKTKMQLSQRMYGYQNPGPSQTTNIRVNKAIKNLLVENQPVDIFILTDNGLLKYGDFRINLAAGLEDTLIYKINPDWNLSGRNLIPVDIESEKPELSKEPKPTAQLIPVLTTISISLGQAYYNQGFFNVGREYSQMFGADNATIDIQLGSSGDTTIQGYINRTANKNGTPRIMGGKELRNWIKSNFKINDTMKVDIISPIAVRLY
ncbi:MAG TPA: GIY-YIG nuclease family protein [Niabella sp.]|nr:GIY-YIG nuclease family protein [Niabella sp.]